MEKVKVLIKSNKSTLPNYGTEFSSGFDVEADLCELKHFQTINENLNIVNGKQYIIKDESVILLPGQRCLIPTGLFLAIPDGYEIQVRPRSGNAIKAGLTVLNTPGTIDCDYRGECNVILINTSDVPLAISDGLKIAQFVVSPVVQAEFEIVKELPSTVRGKGGFGSTDKV